jgi:MFS family permease
MNSGNPQPLDTQSARPRGIPRLPFYYGWVNVLVAALAMLATLPGRTQGLGLVTEPLLADLQLDRGLYAQLNLWATLLGAVFCLPVGRWIDRYGARPVLCLIVLALGGAVWAMSAVTSVAMLFVLVALTRGLGQSALSVTSIALVGKWFGRRISLAMGIYSVLVGLLFAIAFGLVGLAVREQGWRMAWWEIAIALLAGYLPLAWLLARSTPEGCGLPTDTDVDEACAQGMSLAAALRTPAFWVFALATSIYGLVVSGIGLFNESILQELGFDAKTYHTTLVLTSLVALASQFASGWLGWKWSLGRLMALAMGLYACALVWLPQATSHAAVYGNALLVGIAGGTITVVFFAIWPELFGRRHVGLIQGAAQTLTVISSAVGPLLFAECHARTGSYALIFYALAPAVLGLGIAAWIVPKPQTELAVGVAHKSLVPE